MDGWLPAQEAAHRLGVKPTTLYAYVSRGQLRRRLAPDGRRSEYHPGDVVSLAVRGRRARPTRPSDIVLPTAVTAITERGPVYRGSPAVELAGRASFEEVAALLWETEPAADRRPSPRLLESATAAVQHLDDDTAPAARLPAIIAAARSADPLRDALDPPAVVAAARGLLDTVTEVLSGDTGEDRSIAEGLGAALTGRVEPVAVAVVDAALVLLADHELAASTLAVRVAASARCDPYAVVLCGTAVLTGHRHGAASRPLERVLRAVARGEDPAVTLAAELGPGDETAGFGHPLYPGGDPRAERLLALLADSDLDRRGEPLRQVLEVAHRRGLPAPNVDVALAGLTHAIGAAPGSGELLFAVARIAGWVAHALEQYGDPQLLRPRAVYTGS